MFVVIGGSVGALASRTPAYVTNSSAVGPNDRTQSPYPLRAVWEELLPHKIAL